MNSPLFGHQGIVEARQFLRRNRQIGVKNHEDLFFRQRESFAHGVAFALPSCRSIRMVRLSLIFLLHPQNCLPSVVGRIAFDEDKFIVRPHRGRAQNGGLNVARFVPCRDDDRDGGRRQGGTSRQVDRPRYGNIEQVKKPKTRAAAPGTGWPDN